MQLIFVHGPAACGKLTVATQLAKLTGLPLFHNHLVVDVAASLFEFGSAPFVRLREVVWLTAFEEASRAGTSLIFTFHPEASVPLGFPARVIEVVGAHGGEVVFVQLTCPEPEIERRIESASRAAHGKLRSLAQYRSLRAAGAFEYPPLPQPLVSLDTSTLAPAAAARRIVAELAHRP